MSAVTADRELMTAGRQRTQSRSRQGTVEKAVTAGRQGTVEKAVVPERASESSVIT